MNSTRATVLEERGKGRVRTEAREGMTETKTGFQGLLNQADRDALIKYLKSFWEEMQGYCLQRSYRNYGVSDNRLNPFGPKNVFHTLDKVAIRFL